MSRKRLTFSLAALVLGAFIVVISITAVHPWLLAENKLQSSQRRFYVDRSMLPDHIFYPALMAADRLQLELSRPEQRIKLQLEYSWRRLDYARQLLAQDQPDLALTTLTKSQKYLLVAAQESLAPAITTTTRATVLQQLTLYLYTLEPLLINFNDADKAAMIHLMSECQDAKHRLSQSVLP